MSEPRHVLSVRGLVRRFGRIEARDAALAMVAQRDRGQRALVHRAAVLGDWLTVTRIAGSGVHPERRASFASPGIAGDENTAAPLSARPSSEYERSRTTAVSGLNFTKIILVVAGSISSMSGANHRS